MLRRVRRPAALVVPLLLLSGLAACGDDDGSGGDEKEGFDAVEITGDAGSAPEVDWKGRVEAGEPEVETLVEGEGPKLEKGDQVLVNYWVGNGFTQETSIDSFGEETAGSYFTVGEEMQPQQVGDIVPAFVSGYVEEGTTLGSRIAVVASAPEAFGDQVTYLTELGIGNEDSVVIVMDLVGQPVAGPEGKAKPLPSWAPEIVEKKEVPTSLDFSGTPDPNKQLRTTTLVQGSGEKVAKGDILVANYLGQVHGGDKPFDDSYSRGTPAAFPIGLGAVVKGWDKALVGVPVGSRVMLQIPPNLGYGEQGQPQAGIKGTDTLFFVVDVLGAA